MVHKHSPAARAHRAVRAVLRGYVCSPPGDGETWVSVPRWMAPSAKCVLHSMAIHGSHDVAAGATHHYARHAAAAVQSSVAGSSTNAALQVHRLANKAKHEVGRTALRAHAYSLDGHGQIDPLFINDPWAAGRTVSGGLVQSPRILERVPDDPWHHYRGVTAQSRGHCRTKSNRIDMRFEYIEGVLNRLVTAVLHVPRRVLALNDLIPDTSDRHHPHLRTVDIAEVLLRNLVPKPQKEFRVGEGHSDDLSVAAYTTSLLARCTVAADCRHNRSFLTRVYARSASRSDARCIMAAFRAMAADLIDACRNLSGLVHEFN